MFNRKLKAELKRVYEYQNRLFAEILELKEALSVVTADRDNIKHELSSVEKNWLEDKSVGIKLLAENEILNIHLSVLQSVLKQLHIPVKLKA